MSSTGDLLNGSGVANKTQYGQQNNSPTSNLNFLNTEIGFWNGSNPPPDLLAANGPVALNVQSIGDTSSYNAVAGYDYVVFHFGNGPAFGSAGGWQAWYLGGLRGLFTVPIVGGASVGGFSSARYYNPTVSVPDGGATLMLLGTAFGLIAAARRRFVA
jgi:VPDSG-CTERM motif